ncbi:DUF488 domain-containing protein [Edaphobacter acidisoli]|nr:DUF488 domain-containing protein [Edaphobacter acidisoli]
MSLHIKRVYDEPAKSDGTRILVDRLWPRGLSKENAHVDLWLKDVAPSDELRKWFGHEPARWPEFRARYRAEIKKNPAQIALLRQAIGKGPATLVYGAKDEQHNQAVVLYEFLTRNGLPNAAD